jgi:tRNA nucleotidyltransferase/poly(A) polymerase
MLEQVREALAGEAAWVVGGSVRDELLGLREALDVDVVCADPERAARAFARVSGGAPFPISTRHGAWRVVHDDGRTADFTPLHGTIEEDLSRRDFTVNALARPLAGDGLVDPFGGRADLDARTLRHVSDGVFDDDPLRLLRAVRLQDRLGLRLAPGTAQLVREKAQLVGRAAGERILAELEQLSPQGFAALEELGLLAPLGGSLDGLRPGLPPELLLVAVFGRGLERFPIRAEQRRLLRTLLRAERPRDESPREIHRFRRATEPFALEALEYLGATELRGAVEAARAADPPEPLVHGDELGLPPGPEIGRLLELIAEERAAGTISTREEALELARRAGAVRADG